MHMTNKIFSGWNGYGNIIFQGPITAQLFENYFSAKTESQSQHRDSNLAPKPNSQSGSSRQKPAGFLPGHSMDKHTTVHQKSCQLGNKLN